MALPNVVVRDWLGRRRASDGVLLVCVKASGDPSRLLRRKVLRVPLHATERKVQEPEIQVFRAQLGGNRRLLFVGDKEVRMTKLCMICGAGGKRGRIEGLWIVACSECARLVRTDGSVGRPFELCETCGRQLLGRWTYCPECGTERHIEGIRS